MKKYTCLQFLKDRNIEFKYTQFDQGAMVNILDKTWQGSCNILSYSWMWRKICSSDIQKVTSYEITDSHLPHPVVFGDNDIESEDIRNIAKSLQKHYNSDIAQQVSIDYPQGYFFAKPVDSKLDHSIEKLLDHIASKEFHYGIIRLVVSIKDKNNKDKKDEGIPQIFGHAVSFVKKGDSISWFDPNYGEITFAKFSDFRVWLREEVKHGVLKNIFSIPDKERTYSNLADVFPQPKFTSEQKKQNYLSKKITKRRIKDGEARKKITNFKVLDYDLFSFYGNNYVNPAPEVAQDTSIPNNSNNNNNNNNNANTVFTMFATNNQNSEVSISDVKKDSAKSTSFA